MSKKIKPIKKVEGDIVLPGDKSISHRAVMISSIAEGDSKIENFLNAEDCVATVNSFKKMGVEIEIKDNAIIVKGVGLKGLKKPSSPLYLENSGTSLRLLLGILAGQDFESVLSGDKSLSRRPMKRITVPLRQMGANITGRDDANFAPLTIHGGKLTAIDYESPVASAQVKSSILLAGLYANGSTSVREPFKSRDHTERMLALFGTDVSVEGLKVSMGDNRTLLGRDITIPGDISSGSFFIVAALLLRGSELTIRNVGFNMTRTGIIDVLKRMGGAIEVKNMTEDWERVCNLTIRGSSLKATTVAETEIPRIIDELPLLMTAAVFAKGKTVIKGAGELRVKETDRINSMLDNLRRLGAVVNCEGNDVTIEGTGTIHGAELTSFGDHRTVMALAIAALCASGESIMDNVRCVDTSFPGFFDILESISVGR